MTLRRRSVRQLLGTLLATTIVVVLALGLVGTLTVVASTRAVNFLSNELNPSTTSNAHYLHHLLEMQTAAREHALSGDPESLNDFAEARDRLPEDLRALKAYAETHAHLRADVAAQEAAADAWIQGYALPLLETRAGSSKAEMALYEDGVGLLEEVSAINQEISAHLRMESTDAQSMASSRLNASIILIAAVALLGGLGLLVQGIWASRQIRRPLADLEEVVGRLREGDLSARVVPSGPGEFRRVGEALNELADERMRGRDVEFEVQAQLRDIDTAKTDFVSNVSHELRTPLTIINGYLELLDEDLGNDKTLVQANMLVVTRRNVSRLRELIEDLLTLNQAQASGTTLHQIDLGKLVSEVSHDMRFTATSRKVLFELQRPGRAIVVLADPSQIHRAVLNIVSNAVKFSHDNGIVTVGLRQEGTDAVISVVDRGIGVPADELNKLGARFFRASNAILGQVAGTGLGLRIVQTILANHQGSLELESVEGEGTTVRIRLPLQANLDPYADPSADGLTEREESALPRR